MAALLLRCGFLVLALGGVIYAMHALKKDQANDTLRVFLSGAETTFSWCDTRVKSIELGPEDSIVQRKLKWFRETKNQSKELDFVAVEKWFGRHCKLTIEPQPTEGFVEPSPAATLKVEFIKGPGSTLWRQKDGLFKWYDQVFSSSQLKTALSELNDLPAAPSRN